MVTLWLGIEPRTQHDRVRLDRGLASLRAEDPTLEVATDYMSGQTRIGAASELHLEIVVDRLKREFGVEANVGRPQVAYKETLTRDADGEAKYTGTPGGPGQYGHVKIHVYPGDRGSGCIFENAILTGAIPDRFVTPINDGIQAALAYGVLGGYPVHDVRVVLYDGSYHDVDSSDTAFSIAAALAFQAAARRAAPVLLEPIMTVEVTAPEEFMDRVSQELIQRRGQLYFRAQRVQDDGWSTLYARVPVAGMFGYTADLRVRTSGRGTYTMHFAHYAPVESESDEGDRDAAVTARLKPRTPLRDLRASVPEPPPDIDEEL